MLRVEILNQRTASSFLALATTVFEGFLRRLGAVVAAGVWVGSQPAGLALGELRDGTFAVYWIFVLPAFRRQGAGAALLACLEAEVFQHSITISAAYPSSIPNLAAVRRLFEKRRWQERPAIRMICNLDSMIREPWVQSRMIPAGFSAFRWVGSEAEAANRTFSWVSESLAPGPQRTLEPNTSVGISWNGETVAWYLASLVEPGSVCCESFCVRPDARRYGVARVVLAEGLRRQAEALGRGSRTEFTVLKDNTPMLAVVARRLRIHAVQEDDVMLLSKSLRTGAGIRIHQ